MATQPDEKWAVYATETRDDKSFPTEVCGYFRSEKGAKEFVRRMIEMDKLIWPYTIFTRKGNVQMEYTIEQSAPVQRHRDASCKDHHQQGENE
jgi:hypothetical protein